LVGEKMIAFRALGNRLPTVDSGASFRPLLSLVEIAVIRE
jgi:hypothetical protein